MIFCKSEKQSCSVKKGLGNSKNLNFTRDLKRKTPDLTVN